VRRFATIALAVSLLASGTALARTPDADGYAAALTRAIAAKERAMDVNEPPRWEEALRLFQEAAALRTTRECMYEIGVAAERLARQDLAVEAYEAAADLGLVGAPRARAEAFVAAHAAGLARLALRGPAGTRVRVAGVDRGRLPLNRPLVLFPGDIRIDLVDAAGTPASIGVRLQAGHLDVLDLARTPPTVVMPEKMDARPPPPPPAPPPAVRVAPPEPTPRPPVAPSPEPEALQPLSEPPAPPPRDAEADVSTRGWLLASAGVVVAVVAVALIPISSKRIDDNRDSLAGVCATPVMNDTCTAMSGRKDEAQSFSDSIATWKAVRTGAWVGVGVGLATVGAGLILRYHDQTPATASARPSLVVDHDAGHLTLGLAWTYRF
jgi:hypothetical protein